MKTRRFLATLALGLGLTLALLWLLSGGTPFTHADSPHYVTPDCTGVPAPCHTTIQEAVDAAVPSDEILIASGVYTDVNVRPRNDVTTTGVVTQVVYISKTVTIRGGYNADFSFWDPDTYSTTLNAQSQGRVLYITRDITPTIEGLCITGGDAAGLGGSPLGDSGGGVLVISATVTMGNNQVFSNAGDYGGGLYFDNSTNVTLTGNTVISNTAAITGSGGGLYFRNSNGALLMDNLISGNSTVSGTGGGLYFDNSANVTLTGNTISNNKASPLPAGGVGGNGGGVYFDNSPAATLSDNVILENIASWGGGLRFNNSPTATLTTNTISGNVGNHTGWGMKGYGGVYFYESNNATLIGNTISGNSAANWCAGVCFVVSDNAVLIGNAVISNTKVQLGFDGWGVGVYFEASKDARLVDNVIRNNTGQDIDLTGAENILGGGLYIGPNCTVSLISNTISSNGATRGGGLYAAPNSTVVLVSNWITGNAVYDFYGYDPVGYGGGLYLSDCFATLTNTVIADNQADTASHGSGLYIDGSPARLLHTTIARNGGGDGSGVYITGTLSTVALTNTILVSHTVGITVATGNTATLEATLWGTDTWANLADWGGAGTIITGTVNLWGDPDFVDPDAGDYHIGPNSVAIDAGVNAGVDYDIDGDPRPMGHGYDIGADELRIALAVTKEATPDPVFTGSQLAYTIWVTNTGNMDLHATVTDTLPSHVTAAQPLIWTPTITAPGDVWTEQFTVTVEMGYVGPLTNVVEVTTEEGATGVYTETSTSSESMIYLPIILKSY